jgi:uncharacterized membrane protein YidH (DUF202 family)
MQRIKQSDGKQQLDVSCGSLAWEIRTGLSMLVAAIQISKMSRQWRQQVQRIRGSFYYDKYWDRLGREERDDIEIVKISGLKLSCKWNDLSMEMRRQKPWMIEEIKTRGREVRRTRVW